MIVTRASAAFAAVTLMLGLAACADAPPPNVSFDGNKALAYVAHQLEFGARIPGTPAHTAAGDWIAQTLRANADTVVEQRWTHVTAAGDSLPMRNVFAQFNPAATTRILYVTHWDSRPKADKGDTEAERALPVPGANDGASGTAMLLVLAEALKAAPSTVGVDLLFTDGEDYGDFDTMTDVLIGARYYAGNTLPSATYRPMFGVLWDMIGDRNLRFLQEPYSRQFAPEVVDMVWKLGAAMGYARVFDAQSTTTIQDDHVPLGEKGFRIIDVIDLEFPWHHTSRDTIDKVSAESLELVGRVALALIRQAEQ